MKSLPANINWPILDGLFQPNGPPRMVALALYRLTTLWMRQVELVLYPPSTLKIAYSTRALEILPCGDTTRGISRQVQEQIARISPYPKA